MPKFNIARLALVAGIAGLLCAQAPAARAGEDGAKRIAVVNVASVFGAYKKVKDIEAKLRAQYEPNKKDLEVRRDKLKEMEFKIANEIPNGPTNKQQLITVQDYQRAKFELEYDFNELAKKVEKNRMEQMRQVLKDIRSAISEVGKDLNYDMILRAPEYDEEWKRKDDVENEDPGAASASELVRRFRENPVLYFSSGVDVTDKVIAKLNAGYHGDAGGDDGKDAGKDAGKAEK